MRSVWRRLGAAIVIASLLLAWGCGGRNDEVVYLHVFNAYPGTESVSVFGPSGTVASNLPFGKRTSKFKPVNRNIGTDFQVQLAGAPSTTELQLPLFDMYPHESATLMLKRRSGESQIDTNFFRHTRTGYREEDRQCSLVFDNALSTADPQTSTYRYVPVFKVRPECTGYLNRLGSYAEDPEGDSTLEGAPSYIFRPNLVEAVESFPWFVAVNATSGQLLDIRQVGGDNGCPAYSAANLPQTGGSNGGSNGGGGGGSEASGRGQRIAGNDDIQFVWAPVRSILRLEEAEELRNDFGFDPQSQVRIGLDSGSVVAPSPTRKYLECIGWDPEKSAQDNINKLQESEREKILQCKQGTFTARPVELSSRLTQYRFRAGLGADIDPGQCGFRVRVASDFFNTFDRSTQGDRAGGTPVSKRVTFAPSQFAFWVLYGRPIDPLVEFWGVADRSSGGGVVQPPPYPGSPGSSGSSGGSGSGNGSGSDNGSGSNGGSGSNSNGDP